MVISVIIAIKEVVNMKCQCENASHKRPCKNEATYSVATCYGIFKVCVFCAQEAHMGSMPPVLMEEKK